MSVQSEGSEARPRGASAPPAQVVRLAEAEEAFMGREVFYRDLLNALPAAIYTTDAQGKITFYNEAAVEFAGRRPALGDEWCVTWKLYNLDGSPLPHSECPMAIALREGRPNRGAEAIAERPDGTRITFTPFPTPLFDAGGGMVGAVNMLVDISERKAAEDRQRLLVNEVNHRANNMLAVVQAMVRLGKSDSVEDFRETLNGRIEALARTHNLLAKSRWMAADLQHLVSEELAPFMDHQQPRVWISGSILPMEPTAAQSVAMIVHELATNAAKHGALSTPGGKVMIAWRRAAGDRVLFKWTEQGGPAVSRPTRRGVGSTVIARAAAYLEAQVTTAWTPQGLAFELDMPKRALSIEVDG
ncbi:HWE histidine kinase domain-containing protein [Phenylobacterium sp.]|uniref:HWE histidine kinase domain-containing protein n=1 Tax=Phenylobacterium sp. TaxID=1871053 RepID=UPI002C10A385|nr:HWE histidine kinase domain-containing protein [Phenylobacterium sp.]HLZ75521.1 HWE histidine kinase domain-containing protein [Phenylobacterium sp.]